MRNRTTPLAPGFHDVPPGKIAAVVTSLEMTARPAPRPEPALRHVELNRVPTPDVNWYRELYGRVGADWLWFSRQEMPPADLDEILRNGDVHVYALSLDGNAEGILELDFRSMHANGDCELAFFGLTAPLIGAGSGRWLMNRAIELAWAQPIKRFWVHTCTFDHPGALNFYIRSGFTPYKRMIEIADDPRLTGVLPRTAAPHIPIIGS